MSKFANFVAGQLFASVGPSSANITMLVQLGRNLPANPDGELARLLLINDPRRPTKFEVIGYRDYVIVPPSQSEPRQTVVLSGVTRGMDGTNAEHWLAGAYIAQDLPAGLVGALVPGQTGEYLAYDGNHLRPRPLTRLDLAGNPFADGPILLSSTSLPADPPATGAILGYQDSAITGTERLYAVFASGTIVTIQDAGS